MTIADISFVCDVAQFLRERDRRTIINEQGYELISKNFEEDFDEVVERWRSKGVKKLLHACVELEEIPKIKFISFSIYFFFILKKE